MSGIILNREIVHYEVLGRGRPVLLLHGWVGSWRYWIPVMQTVSTAFRAYALDLYGYGDTAKHAERYNLDQQVELLNGFMEEMGILKLGLVGHGLGALVAMRFASRYPQLVDRLMAIGLPVGGAGLHARLRSATPQALAEWLLPRNPLTEPVLTDTPKTDPLAIQSPAEMMAALNGSYREDLGSTACLYVYGEQDPLVPPPPETVLANLPGQQHIIQFEGCGHFPMLEESSKFNRLLMDFLNLPSGESPAVLQLKEEWKRRVR